MSHFTTIHTQIRDLDALADACAELGVALVPDATGRGYAGMLRKAPHVIRLKGPYDPNDRQCKHEYQITA